MVPQHFLEQDLLGLGSAQYFTKEPLHPTAPDDLAQLFFRGPGNHKKRTAFAMSREELFRPLHPWSGHNIFGDIFGKLLTQRLELLIGQRSIQDISVNGPEFLESGHASVL